MSNRTTLNSYLLTEYQTLVEMLQEMSDLLCENVEYLYICKLPVNELGDERKQPHQINVENVYNDVSEKSKHFLRQSIQQIKLNPFEESTYLAKRFPGFVVLPKNIKSTFIDLNNRLNAQKKAFHEAAKKGFNNRQSAHENLHELIPNIVLLSATRQLRYLCDEEITSVCLYWQYKKMQKHVKHSVAEEIINNSVKHTNQDIFGLTPTELLDRQKNELLQLASVKAKKIVEIRYARVQPYIDIWIKKKTESRAKRGISSNAVLPIVLFGQPRNLTRLKNYEYVEPKPINLPVLNARKNWYILK